MKTRSCKTLFTRMLALSIAACLSFPSTAFASSTNTEDRSSENVISTDEEIPFSDFVGEEYSNPLDNASPNETLESAHQTDSKETGSSESEQDDLLDKDVQIFKNAAVDDESIQNPAAEEGMPASGKSEQGPDAQKTSDGEGSPDVSRQEPELSQEGGDVPEQEGQEPEAGKAGDIPSENENQAPEPPQTRETAFENDDQVPETPQAGETSSEIEGRASGALQPGADSSVQGEVQKAPGTPDEDATDGAISGEGDEDTALFPNTGFEDDLACAITLDLNGGSWTSYGSYKDSDGRLDADMEETLDLPDDNDVTRTGYEFMGWTITKDGTDYVDIDDYWPDGDTTLYASWEKLIGVKFDLNGGSWVSGTYEETNYKDIFYVEEGTEGISLPNEFAAIRKGYGLEGWTLTKNNGTVYSHYYGELTKDVTFYARWQKTCTATFNLNGGKWVGDYSSHWKVYKNESVYLPDDSDLVRKGYVFKGWTLMKNKGAVYERYYKLTKDVTFYAKWEKAAYTVTLNLNGGKWAYDSVKERWKDGYSVAKNESVYLPSDVEVIRKGYVIKGWTLEKNKGEVYDTYSPSKTVTLYARWEKMVTVTVNLNGGKWEKEDWESDSAKEDWEKGYLVARNKRFSLPYSWEVTRKGYVLKGWTLEKNKGKVYSGYYCASKSVTLYARWVKPDKVTVTLDAGKGYFDEDNINNHKETFKIEKGAAPDLDNYTPVNDSKSFGGWYKDAKLTKPVKKSDTISKNTTFYAKWISRKTYKITVTNLKGASYHIGETYQDADNSKSASASFYIAQGERIGDLYANKDGTLATFYLDKDCKTKPFYEDYVPAKDTTVYAKFKSLITITWDANGGWVKNRKHERGEEDNIIKGTVWWEGNAIRKGHYLAGWYDVKQPSVILSAGHVFTKNTKVKAKWKKGIKVVLNPNGGYWEPEDVMEFAYSGWYDDAGGEKITAYSKAKAKVGEYVDDIYTPSRSGYTFSGWKSSLTNKKVKDILQDKPAKDVTYTAIWTKDTVKVTVVGGDGSIYDPETKSYVAKKTFVLPKNTTLSDFNARIDIRHDEPSKGQSNVGWSLKKSGTALKDTYKFTKNTTLYPLWKKVTHYQVALIGKGGVIDKEIDYTLRARVLSVSKGSAISLPTSSEIEREGYTFVGWYTDYECTKKVSNPGKYKPTKSVYLYAKWKKK